MFFTMVFWVFFQTRVVLGKTSVRMIKIIGLCQTNQTSRAFILSWVISNNSLNPLMLQFSHIENGNDCDMGCGYSVLFQLVEDCV